MRYQQISGFEGLYEISDTGEVRSLDRTTPIKNGSNGIDKRFVPGKTISQWSNHRGYKLVSLHKDGRKFAFQIHRLIAQSFISNPENKPEVNHINGIKDDNRIENLEWSTRLENQRHSVYILGKHHAGEAHYNAKTSVDTVLKMRELYKTGNYYMKELAKMFGLSKSQAERIIGNKTWKTLKRIKNEVSTD